MMNRTARTLRNAERRSNAIYEPPPIKRQRILPLPTMIAAGALAMVVLWKILPLAMVIIKALGEVAR